MLTDNANVWRNGDGAPEIVEGHGRVLAAKRLGMGQVPVIGLNHLSDEQRRAYTHVHNQLTMSTGWEPETLQLDLQELPFDWNRNPRRVRCRGCGREFELSEREQAIVAKLNEAARRAR